MTEVKYLPDPHKKMSAKPYSYFASLKSTMSFENAVLKDAKDVSDSTAVPKAILAAVKELAPLLLAALNKAGSDELSLPPPHIYKIVVNGSQVDFIGGPGQEPIRITLLPETKEGSQ